MDVVFFLYENMTALDFVGPYEILSRLPGSHVYRAGIELGTVRTDAGLGIQVDHVFHDVQKADVLVIPGSGKALKFQNNPDVLSWIQKLHKTTTWTASVCTGSLILAAAGLLQEKQATTHWVAADLLQSLGARFVPSRVVEDGKIITSAGVSAGIDMALLLTAKIAGRDYAEVMQLALEYDPEPPFNTGSPVKAPKAMVEILREKMVSRFE